jgi:hypothetical protein
MSRGRKKKKAKGGQGARKAWIAFLRGEGVAPGQLSDEVQAARDLVSGSGERLPEVSGEVAEALAVVLAEQQQVEPLVRCAEQGTKSLAKASRRALHGLKRRGAEVPRITSKAAGDEAAETDAHEDARAVMSAPFGNGDRGLVFRYRGTTDRVLHSGLAMVSDHAGIRDLQLFRGGAKTYRSMLESARTSLTLAPVPIGYALGLVEQGARDTEARGRLLPDLYRSLRQHLGDGWPEPGAHPGADLEPAALPDAEGQFKLWELPEIRTWLADSELTNELAAGIGEVLSSTIVLSETQRLERLGEVLDQMTAKVFDDRGRPLWLARLRDAAYVASQNRRGDEAARLLAVRESLAGSDTPEQLPFCRQLVARPLLGRLPEPFASGLIPGLPAAPEAEPAPEPESPSLLWTPDSDPEPGPEGGGGLIVPGR